MLDLLWGQCLLQNLVEVLLRSQITKYSDLGLILVPFELLEYKEWQTFALELS